MSLPRLHSFFMLDPSTLPPAAQQALLVEAVHFSHVTRYSHVAAYSIFVWDWLLCFEDEIDLLTQGGSWRGKLAYLFCRYYPLLTYPITMWIQMNDHNPELCSHIFSVPMFLIILNLAGAASILILRIYAFTGGKISVVWFLCACLAAVATFQAYVAGAKSSLIPLPIGCYPVDNGPLKYLSGYFLSALLFDCVVTGTFITFTITKMHTSFSSMTDFTKMFIREGAIYFLAISAINIINAYFNYQPNILMATVNVPMSLLLPNVLACRLVINLRATKKDSGSSFHPLSVNSSNGAAQSGITHFTNNQTTTFEVAMDDLSDSASRRPSVLKWGNTKVHGSRPSSRQPSVIGLHNAGSRTHLPHTTKGGHLGVPMTDEDQKRSQVSVVIIEDPRRPATPEELRAYGAV
ncbi:hypothetical protein BKA62DRAFT_698165 [Auriculariales sp. MPI-PUGE-AT-0066]|nr:hypothetical protein BKA62DRAFT_698165 [Auriculariales sp. MPI-PUGE-AT-0066]